MKPVGNARESKRAKESKKVAMTRKDAVVAQACLCCRYL